MPLIRMTRELAFAASLDAANRAMRAAGRKRWSKQDKLAASREFNRLWPVCEHGIEPESFCFFCDKHNASAGTSASSPRSAL